jgi:hypothetical protein
MLSADIYMHLHNHPKQDIEHFHHIQKFSLVTFYTSPLHQRQHLQNYRKYKYLFGLVTQKNTHKLSP